MSWRKLEKQCHTRVNWNGNPPGGEIKMKMFQIKYIVAYQHDVTVTGESFLAYSWGFWLL